MLSSEFRARRERNPLYSLRAFARDLQLSPGILSQVLSAKRGFSRRNAEKVADRLAFSPTQRRRFFGETLPTEFVEIRDDEFRLISDWYCLAILNLARLAQNQAEPSWVADRLGISTREAKEAIERLTRLGYLKVERGKLRRNPQAITTSRDIASTAIRAHHRQNLDRAARALDDVPVELREISSMTLAVRRDRIAEAKAKIVQFQKAFDAEMSSDQPDQVYTLAVQFFPPLPAAKPKSPRGKRA
jgi:DNA-binding Lrp family transcriptional regulator